MSDDIHEHRSLEARAAAEAEGRSVPMTRLRCIVVTPEATVLDEPTDFVALPLYDGEIGFARARAPMIGRLGYGELRLVSDHTTKRFYVDGGFVQVADDVVSVLTSRAVPAADLDAAVAAEHLAEARKRKANSDESFAHRDRHEQRARAQIWVAERAK